MNKKLFIGLHIVGFLVLGAIVLAAPVVNFQPSVVPNFDNRYYLGTTTPNKLYWSNIYSNNLSVGSGTGTTTISFSSSTFGSTTVQGYFNTGILTATSSITTNNLTVNGTCTGCGSGSVYPFTPTSNLGQTMSATSSSILITGSNGFYANGASQFSTTTVQGYFNTGIITSTSTGNYLGDLTLGTKLPNAQLANSTISGVALGGTLANLTALNGTLTFSATYTGASAVTIGLNLNSENTWTASTTIPLLNTGVITSTSSITAKNLIVTASSTYAGNLTINGSATSTQDFTVLGKFANKQGSSTVNMTGVTLIDFNALGTRQKWMMSGATQLVLNATSSNPLAGMTFLIDICNGSGSVLTFVTPQALRWDGTNGTTTFTSTANQHQMFWGYYDGSTSMNHIVGSSTPTICL